MSAFLATLTPAELVDYWSTLRGSYEQIVWIEVLDNNRRLQSTVRATVLGGQVNAKRIELDPTYDRDDDQSIDVSRELRGLALFDPSHAIALDATSPADGALFLDRLIRVMVAIRGRLRWYEQCVFIGPITDLDREGAIVTVDADGMESFALGAAFVNGSIPQGTKVAAVREMMHRTGELNAYMDLPPVDEKLPSKIPVVRDTRYWDKSFAVMASMNRQCFYDAPGYLRTPVPVTAPSVVFDEGDDGLLLGEPQVTHSLDGFANAWWQQTSTKKGRDVEATDQLRAPHALTPEKLGRIGQDGKVKPRFLMGTESNPDLRTAAKAKVRAGTRLKLAAPELLVKTTCRPIFHLEPIQWGLLATRKWSGAFPILEQSLPLAGGPMTVGYRELLGSPNVAKIRGV